MSKRRAWEDACEHPEESYLGTVMNSQGEWLDAYLVVSLNDEGNYEFTDCVRFGNEPHEYKSGATSCTTKTSETMEILAGQSRPRHVNGHEGVGRAPGCPAMALILHHYEEITRSDAKNTFSLPRVLIDGLRGGAGER